MLKPTLHLTFILLRATLDGSTIKTCFSSLPGIRTLSHISAMSRRQVNTYLPLPRRDLIEPPPVYRLPTLITTYSHLPDRSIVHDDTSMAYHRRAPIGSDLTHGFDEQVEREDLDEHLDGLCEAIMNLEKRGKKALRRGGVVTWRGMMTRWVQQGVVSIAIWEADCGLC